MCDLRHAMVDVRRMLLEVRATAEESFSGEGAVDSVEQDGRRRTRPDALLPKTDGTRTRFATLNIFPIGPTATQFLYFSCDTIGQFRFCAKTMINGGGGQHLLVASNAPPTVAADCRLQY